MVERLTGRPVRVVDASDLPSAELEYPKPERPPALSSRSDWGVSLGVMNRGSYGIDESATEVVARASAVTEDASRQDLTMSLQLSDRFVADQRNRVRNGIPPLSDPLLITFGGNVSSLSNGASSYAVDLDPRSGIARVTVGVDAVPADVQGAISAARLLVGSQPLSPTAGIPTIVVATAVTMANSFVADRPPRLDAYRPVNDERTEAIQLDVSV